MLLNIMPESRIYSNKYVVSPNQSFTVIIATVDQLIDMCVTQSNRVNYKIVQAILYILARQMKMLEKKVDLGTELPITEVTKKSVSIDKAASMKKERGTSLVKSEKIEISKSEKQDQPSGYAQSSAKMVKRKGMENKLTASNIGAFIEEKEVEQKDPLAKSKHYKIRKNIETYQKEHDIRKIEDYILEKAFNENKPEDVGVEIKDMEELETKYTDLTGDETEMRSGVEKKHSPESQEARNLKKQQRIRKGEEKQPKNYKSRNENEILPMHKITEKPYQDEKNKIVYDKNIQIVEKDEAQKSLDAMSSRQVTEKKKIPIQTDENVGISESEKELRKKNIKQRRDLTNKIKATNLYEPAYKKLREGTEKTKTRPSENDNYEDQFDIKSDDGELINTEYKKDDNAMMTKSRDETEKTKIKRKTDENEMANLDTMDPKERERYVHEKKRKIYQENEKEMAELSKIKDDEIISYDKDKTLKSKSLKEKMTTSKKIQKDVKDKTPNIEENKNLYEHDKKVISTEIFTKTKKAKDQSKIEDELKRQRIEEATLAKMSDEERSRYDKEKYIEKKKLATLHKKEKEEDNIKKDHRNSLSITEEDDILIVERRRIRSDTRNRVGSIEVVTMSQFRLLELKVNELEAVAAPLPYPAMPDNDKLREDLTKGSASLTDTMQAMQISARVQAAEAAINRLGSLLTQLASSGALPKGVADKLGEKMFSPSFSRKSSRRETDIRMLPTPSGGKRATITADGLETYPTLSATSSVVSRVPCVTHPEMDKALRELKDEMIKHANALTAKVQKGADYATSNVKHVVDKMEVAARLNSRVDDLYGLVNDYTDQLSGFDAGITTQLHSFNEQIVQMHRDMAEGSAQFIATTTNTETEAVRDLHTRYEELLSLLGVTIHTHNELDIFQKQLSLDLNNLLKQVEMLQEEKADRDEVLDGLRDKADKTSLAGVLKMADFKKVVEFLGMKLDACYDKFKKQDNTWMRAISEISSLANNKSEYAELMHLKDKVQEKLNDMKKELSVLGVALGEPKAAMLTRQLAQRCQCGICKVPALQDLTTTCDRPPLLPAIMSRNVPATEPCVPWHRDQGTAVQTNERFPPIAEHVCHRWAGGSHTLINDRVSRQSADPTYPPGPPSWAHLECGTDGKVYRLMEPLEPCLECNQVVPEVAEGLGAGDSGIKKTELFPKLSK